MRRILIVLIRGYQMLISPVLPPSCRFEPTCSNYAVEAVRVHGVFKGSWLALRRLGRCHPFGSGGYDPVPGCGCHSAEGKHHENAMSHGAEHSLSSPVEANRGDAEAAPNSSSKPPSHPSN